MLLKFKQIKREYIFGILVIIFSLINIHNVFSGIRIESLIVSIIGIVGAAFMKDKKWAIYLLWIWVYAQLIVIEPIWNASQFLELKLGLTITLKIGTKCFIGVNFVAVVCLGIIKFLILNTLVGKEIKLRSYRQDSFLSEFLPSRFIIEKVVKLNKEQKWLLIKQLDAVMPIYGLICPKNQESLKPKKVGQMLQFRLVKNPDEIEKDNNLEDFKQGGFVLITNREPKISINLQEIENIETYGDNQSV